jgi:hypothetical protein
MQSHSRSYQFPRPVLEPPPVSQPDLELDLSYQPFLRNTKMSLFVGVG